MKLLQLKSIRESIRLLSVKQIVYSEHGDPTKMLRLETKDIPDELQSDEVLVKWQAAPINPSDLNQIQGVYPVKPAVPAIGGNEGSGWIEKVGSGAKNINVGDLVVPAQAGLGTWRTHGIHKGSDVFSIDKDLDRNVSAMLQTNPATAYRMLHDFVELSPGDVIIQNGSNSGVGRFVIQIAKILKLDLINVVRNRPKIQDLKEELVKLGANVVHTEEEFAKAAKVISNVRLALNCVGGKSSLLLAKSLATGGVMVTYGGMSRKPIEIPTGPLIFKDITLRGFWISKWYENDAPYFEKRLEMYAHLAEWFKTGQLKTSIVEEHKIEDFKTALERASTISNVKQLFVFS